MLKIENAVLIVIDVQGKLAGIMNDPDYLRRILGMMKAAKFLGIPVILTEQAPEKIGTTVDTVRNFVPNVQPIAKQTFSCCGEPLFMDAVKSSGRKQILVCGIEAHVCVYQTVRDLVKAGYDVYLVVDAVSSRVAVDREIGIHRSQREGAVLTTLEMTVTELMQSTRHPSFREIMKILKENK